MRLAFLGLIVFAASASASQAIAGNIDSAYTKLNFENNCVWKKPASEEEAGMGGSAVCEGYKSGGIHWPVHFAEGDIRQFVSFGKISDINSLAGGFSQWNSVNTTIEWRLNNSKPFATILRWFIDNVDLDTGSADKKSQGNVLVVTKVAQANSTDSCVIGYVDARANKNANVMARQAADKYGGSFVCRLDEARFYGKRGKYSGSPNELADDQRRY